MKSGLKTLGMWLILGVIFVVLLVTIIDGSNTKMTYSELITKMEQSDVKEIEISYDPHVPLLDIRSPHPTTERFTSLCLLLPYLQ